MAFGKHHLVISIDSLGLKESKGINIDIANNNVIPINCELVIVEEWDTYNKAALKNEYKNETDEEEKEFIQMWIDSIEEIIDNLKKYLYFLKERNMKHQIFASFIGAVTLMSISSSCGNSGKTQAASDTVADSLTVVDTESHVALEPFVGKTYEGSGNGGGLYTEMSITFWEDGKCKGTSDWYQAYSEKKTINGTYQVAGDKLIATFMVDGVEMKLEFDVSDNGRVLSFDHSDPEMGGTMGIDIMSLQLNESSFSTAAAKQDSIEANTHSPEVIQKRVKEMFGKDEFFSKDYKSISKKLQDAGDKYFPGEIVGPDYVVWDTSQGGCGEGNTKFGEVENVTEKTAVIKVFNKFECDENHDVVLHLVFENGDWFVDDISNSFSKSLKNDMKKELKDIVNSSN